MRKLLFLTIILSLSSLSLFSLPPGGLGPPGGGGDPDNDPAIPIDGGVSLLIAAGAALGGAKLFRKKAKEES